MKKNKLLLFAVACTTALSFGCKGGTPASPSASDEEFRTAVVQYNREDSSYEVKYHVDYPVAGNPILVDSLKSFIAQALLEESSSGVSLEGEKLVNMVAEKKISQLLSDRGEMESEVEFEVPPYEYDCSITLDCDTDLYVTYSVSVYTYLGGAHGGALGYCASFDKVSGERLGYNLLKNTDKPEFHELLKEGLRDYFGTSGEVVETDGQLSDMLLIEGGADSISAPVFDPWISKDGFVFFYQQYEIAPYAAGMPSFVISFDAIRPFLTDKALKLLQL